MGLDRGHVLVGGWPGSGKSTLSRALADHWGMSWLSKDEVKEALVDALGAPPTVAKSQSLGRAAVHAVLRIAASCPAAVRDARHLDDQRTDPELWGTEVAPLGVGPLIEVDTSAPVDVSTVAARVEAALR